MYSHNCVLQIHFNFYAVVSTHLYVIRCIFPCICVCVWVYAVEMALQQSMYNNDDHQFWKIMCRYRRKISETVNVVYVLWIKCIHVCMMCIRFLHRIYGPLRIVDTKNIWNSQHTQKKRIFFFSSFIYLMSSSYITGEESFNVDILSLNISFNRKTVVLSAHKTCQCGRVYVLCMRKHPINLSDGIILWIHSKIINKSNFNPNNLFHIFFFMVNDFLPSKKCLHTLCDYWWW